MSTRLLVAPSLLFVLVLVGCSTDKRPKTFLVEGTVTLDGQTIKEALITCVPESPVSSSAGDGISDANGKFSLKSFPEKPGLVPGKYKIKIDKIDTAVSDQGGEVIVKSKSIVPSKYLKAETSGIVVEVTDKDLKDLKFELLSK